MLTQLKFKEGSYPQIKERLMLHVKEHRKVLDQVVGRLRAPVWYQTYLVQRQLKLALGRPA